MSELVTIIQRFYQEIWTDGNEQTIHELIHPDYHPEDVAMPEKGPDLLIKETRYFRSIFTDLSYRILDYNIKNETEIWTIYEIQGIHTSSAWGFAATAKQVRGLGMGRFTVRDSKIVDQQRIYSLYDLFVSSGAVPEFWQLAEQLSS